MKAKYILLLLSCIISTSFIFCAYCGTNPPLDSSYCGNYLELNSTHRCCYCNHTLTGKHYCILIINDTFPSDEYKCTCENILENDDLPGAPCRNHAYTLEHPEEISKEYCHKQSIDDKHPCCYYDDGKVKKCFGIGKITSYTLYTYNEFLDCFSKYQTINYFIIFFILIFFL